ncbi:hypothetical protein DPMN_095561 [Dreissena polymorpha]|uniref:Uncharacterized protein n=1 Tax=Dreissena polymorpha TaxID=45954 RepID=A0A9D4L873_DREPO|nr:hypothetical protein DPMN_095561 [Dreissena polymorpha]
MDASSKQVRWFSQRTDNNDDRPCKQVQRNPRRRTKSGEYQKQALSASATHSHTLIEQCTDLGSLSQRSQSSAQRMFMFPNLKEMKWLAQYTKSPEYWQGIFSQIRQYEKKTGMSIEDIMDTDLEQSLDQTIVKAFEQADTITDVLSDGEESFQCGQRIRYDSDSSSSGEAPGLTMGDLEIQQAQHIPSVASLMGDQTVAEDTEESPKPCASKCKEEGDIQDGIWIANKIRKTETIIIPSPSSSPATPPKAPKRRKLTSFFTREKK